MKKIIVGEKGKHRRKDRGPDAKAHGGQSTASRNTIDRLGIGVSSVSPSPTHERDRNGRCRVQEMQRGARQRAENAQARPFRLRLALPRDEMDGDILRPANQLMRQRPAQAVR